MGRNSAAKKGKLSKEKLKELSAKELLEVARVPYRRLFGYVKPYRGRFFTGIGIGVIAGLWSSVIAFAFKFIFSVILSGYEPGEAAVFQPFSNIDFIPALRDFTVRAPELPPGYGWLWLTGVCAIIPLMIFVRGFLAYLQTYCMLWVGNRVLYQLRNDVFANLLRQSLAYYGKSKTGELMQTVFNRTGTIQRAATSLSSSVVLHPVSILTTIAVLFVLDWKYSLAALLVFPLCILPVLAVGKRVRKAGGKEEKGAGALMVGIQETFSGIRVVKSYASEDHERERFNRTSRSILASIMKWKKATELVGPMVETVASVGIAAGLIYAKVTGMPLEDFMVMNIMLIGMYPHAKALSKVQVEMQKCLVAMDSVFAAIDQEPDIQDTPDAIELRDVEGRIRFENVTFTYPLADAPAVRGINLTLEPGKTYALVGKSGSGKSTLMSLTMRFFDPQEGRITLDDYDIRQVTQHSLRDRIGIVNQEVFLFHDTIYNNILYGNPEATEEEVHRAAKRAHAHDFILEKEGGYQAVVGDKGCTLSGGQQQRVSIARAILRDAPILLLDEAYSALDSESEKMIHAAMEELSKGKTVIAIAHRLSTILSADRIFVMADGEIVDEGKHEELLDSSEAYQNLYNLQFHGHLPG